MDTVMSNTREYIMELKETILKQQVKLSRITEIVSAPNITGDFKISIIKKELQ